MDTPVVPILFAEELIERDLTRLPDTARVALDRLRREIADAGGLPTTRMKRCDSEGRDGTNLDGCVKTYVPWSENKWGIVFVGVAHPDRPFALRAFAYGVRHPTGTTPSVYRIAHRRLHDAA